MTVANEWLRNLRKTAGITAHEVARRMDVSDTYYYYLEMGARKLSFLALVKLLRSMRCRMTPEIVEDWLRSYGSAALEAGKERWRHRLLAMIVIIWPHLTEGSAETLSASIEEILRLQTPE